MKSTKFASEPLERFAECHAFVTMGDATPMASASRPEAAVEAAETYAALVEERLGKVVDATYRHGSVATHSGGERDEVRQSLRYMNALLLELLPRTGR
jgi:hypothetical protein